MRSHAFVTVSPIENRALFCPNCAFERCSSVNPCMCFLRTALPKGIEYSRGETNLNSFIPQVMFSSGIIARVCMGLRDIFQFAIFVSSQTPGGYPKQFYTGRLRPEVQPLTPLYTIFSEKAPLSYTFYWKKAPLSYTFLRINR